MTKVMRWKIHRITILWEIKSTILTSLFIVCPVSIIASDPENSSDRFYRHEMNLSIGYIYVRNGWSNEYENNVQKEIGHYFLDGTNVYLYKWENGSPKLKPSSPLINLSYYYHLNPRLALGVSFGFCGVKDPWGYPELYELEQNNKETGSTDVKGISLFLMPSVKLSIMNYRMFSFYVKLSAGVHHQNLYLDSDLIPAQQFEEYKKHHSNFAYNVTPLGWEMGLKNIRWFIEFGLGSNSNIQTGVAYRFGEY